MVYPGAVHNRFGHGLGAMYIAGKLFNKIFDEQAYLASFFSDEEKQYLREVVRFAGLLHDVGHMPFSHAAETAMPNFKDLDTPRDWFKNYDDTRQAVHEDYSVLLVYEMARRGETVLGLSEAQDICSLIHQDVRPSDEWHKTFGHDRENVHDLLKSFISGEIDADRMDYLLRDSYYTGVSYGHYDIDWLIHNIGGLKIDNKFVMTISGDGVRAFEDYLLARYHMLIQVHFHKTSTCFRYYLKKIFSLREIDFQVPADADAYVNLRDGSVLEKMFEAAHQGKEWSKRLIDRSPAKRIIRFQHEDEIADENRITDLLGELFKKNNIRWFKTTHKQALSSFGTPYATPLLVARDRFNKTIFEPIDEYSELLMSYNKRIYLTDIYVLREDYPRAEPLLAKLDL